MLDWFGKTASSTPQWIEAEIIEGYPALVRTLAGVTIPTATSDEILTEDLSALIEEGNGSI